MINKELRDYISEEHEKAVVFNVPSYDNAIVGLSDDCRVIYDYELMVKEYMTEHQATEEEAHEYLEYNTIKTLPYIEECVRPIILYNSTMIKEIRENYDSNKT